MITQPVQTRDHTEKMLAAFGADIRVETLAGGGERIHVRTGCPIFAAATSKCRAIRLRPLFRWWRP